MKGIKIALIALFIGSSTAWSQTEPTRKKVKSRAPAQAEETNPAGGVGAEVEPERDAVEEPTAEVKPPKKKLKEAAKRDDRRWRFALGLGYQLVANEAKFDDAEYTATGETISGEATLKYKPTYSLILEGRFTPKNGWGVITGLNLEGEREFDSGKLKGGGYDITLEGGSGASKVQFTTLYGSAVYRWEQFYLPFGLNYSIVKFKPGSGYTGSAEEGGGIGAQLGVGYMFNEHFALEAYSWVTAMSLKDDSRPDYVLDYGVGYFPSIVLVAKYAF